ncbi:MAG: hypothetical protein Aurels2KO_21470 [Aureliella sp.]
MRLRILGSTGDARGSQLETLTVRILESLNFNSVVKNKISNGGHEIDVEAKFTFPSIDRPRQTRLLCECKAHSKPIGTADWLKFLGKVFTERATRTDSVSGMLIALSGVNGNVQGQYDTLKQHCEDIEVVAGDKLIEVIKRHYALTPVAEVISAVQKLTSKPHINIDLAYYSSEFVYVITFPANNYTLVASNPQLPRDQLKVFCQLVSLDESLGEYVDLAVEAEAVRHRTNVKKAVLGILLDSGNEHQDVSMISDALRSLSGEALTSDDVAKACDELVDDTVVETSGGKFRVVVSHDKTIEVRVKLFHALLAGWARVSSIGSPLYDELIDGSLVDHVAQVHSVPRFTGGDRESMVRVLQLSPMALVAAVTPPTRTSGKKDEPPLGMHPKMDGFRLSVLRQELIDRLLTDYRRPELKEYFFELRGVREIGALRHLKIQSTTGEPIELNTQERLGIGEADESLGGGYIQIRLADFAPGTTLGFEASNENEGN